jgi:hypothetical protein
MHPINILDAVKRELEARKHPTVPSRRPGRNSLSRPFDKHTFNKWRNNCIVELAELLAWRSTLSTEKKRVYLDSALGELPDESASLGDRRAPTGHLLR